MRILIVFNRYEYRGGEDTYVDNLTQLLRAHGDVVRVFTKDSRHIQGVISKIRTAVGMFWNPSVCIELTKIINEFKPDVAHFHNIYPLISPTAYKVCKEKGIPIIQTIHNYKFMCPKNDLYRNGNICELCPKRHSFLPSLLFGCYHKSRFATLIYVVSFLFHKARGSFGFVDAFIFPSQFTSIYYAKNTGLDERKFHYLPHLVYSKQKKQKNKKNDEFFLYVGRLTEEKGILPLARSMANDGKLHLCIIGDGPLKKKIQLISAINPNIKYLGQKNHTDTLNYISLSNAVIVPSLWYEVLPNVILEAIRMNKYVFVPQHNPNLKRLKLTSSKILLYSSLKHLIMQLKKDLPISPINKKQDALMQKTTPDYHYKKLISIYKKTKDNPR